MNKLILTAEAKRDLYDIKSYVTNRLKNGNAALRIVGSITRELHGLEQYPLIGRLLDSELNESGYRALVCGQYLAFYRFDGKTVFVDRILYGRRDYMALLFDADDLSDDKNMEECPD